MAFKLYDVDDRSSFEIPVKSYTCTSESDIEKLPRFKVPGTQVLDDHDPIDNAPCGYGSTAMVKKGGVYMLYPDNAWDVIE